MKNETYFLYCLIWAVFFYVLYQMDLLTNAVIVYSQISFFVLLHLIRWKIDSKKETV